MLKVPGWAEAENRGTESEGLPGGGASRLFQEEAESVDPTCGAAAGAEGFPKGLMGEMG